MKIFHELHSLVSLRKVLITFIALIPKPIGASEMKNFPSISLVNGVYKKFLKSLPII